MGGYFAFVGNQYRLEIDGEEFFIDLLLYHRQLRCLVAIELKIGSFKPEYAGKMQFYLSALNDITKLPDENPSIARRNDCKNTAVTGLIGGNFRNLEEKDGFR